MKTTYSMWLHDKILPLVYDDKIKPNKRQILLRYKFI